jgi:uncharacterized protein (TIGR02145 family)
MKKYCLLFLVLVASSNLVLAQNGISNSITFNYNPSIFSTNIFKQKGWSVLGEYNKGLGYKLDNASFNRYSANLYGKYIFTGKQNIFRYKRRFFPGVMLGCSSHSLGGLFQSNHLMGTLGVRFNLSDKKSEYDYVAMALTGMYRIDQMKGFNLDQLNLVHADDPLLQGDFNLRLKIFQPRLNAEWSQLLGGTNLWSAAVCYSPLDWKGSEHFTSNGVSAKVVWHPLIQKVNSGNDKYFDHEKYVQSGCGNTWSLGYSNWNNDQMLFMQFELSPILIGNPEYKQQKALAKPKTMGKDIIEEVDLKIDESGFKKVLGRFYGQNIAAGMNLGYRFGNSKNLNACFFVRWSLVNYDRQNRYCDDTQTALVGYSQSFGSFQNIGGVSTYMYEYSSEQLTEDCEILGSNFLAKMNSFTKGNEEQMRFLYTQLSNCPCYEQYRERASCELAKEKFEEKRIVEEKVPEVGLIGKNKWTKSNLKLTGVGSIKFKLAKNEEDWMRFCDSKTPAYCYTGFSDSESESRGYLYNKSAMEAMQNDENFQYRIPSLEEWNELFKLTHEDIPFPCLSRSSDCLDMCVQKFVDFNFAKDGMIGKWSEQNDGCSFSQSKTAFWINQKSDVSIVYFRECVREESMNGIDPNYIGAYIRLIKK